ncbi:uncharacterized protein LOC112982734 isoform X2 [Dromaius novaehollandiae]|uniref:uncharacterized protein LOC112982734 isoform X2 n=1 Tax=Dromaius novaehollandiae TaxID=8790 RepID=UPI00311DDEAE
MQGAPGCFPTNLLCCRQVPGDKPSSVSRLPPPLPALPLGSGLRRCSWMGRGKQSPLRARAPRKGSSAEPPHRALACSAPVASAGPASLLPSCSGRGGPAMSGWVLRAVQRRRACLPHLPHLASGGLQRRPHVAALSHAYSTKEESSARPIGRYPIPNKKDMPYDIVELMEEVEMKTGFLPNVFKAMSHRPAEFRAFFAYYNAIMNKDTGQLSKADKELIIVATSVVNRCPYCVVAHGALHRIYSKQPALADQSFDASVCGSQHRQRRAIRHGWGPNTIPGLLLFIGHCELETG